MLEPIRLETQRLTLRMFTKADAEDVCRQLADPDVMRYYPAPMSRDESAKWLEGILRDYQTNGFGMLAVHSSATGEYVGQTGVMRRMVDGSERHYLAYLIRKEFWGQGYATEAVRALLDYGFGTLGIRRVVALIRPDNKRSVRLAERLGMQMESTTVHQGVDHCIYVLIR